MDKSSVDPEEPVVAHEQVRVLSEVNTKGGLHKQHGMGHKYIYYHC